jgi:hypothetical protein
MSRFFPANLANADLEKTHRRTEEKTLVLLYFSFCIPQNNQPIQSMPNSTARLIRTLGLKTYPRFLSSAKTISPQYSKSSWSWSPITSLIVAYGGTFASKLRNSPADEPTLTLILCVVFSTVVTISLWYPANGVAISNLLAIFPTSNPIDSATLRD